MVILFHTVIDGVKRTFLGAMLDLEEYIELPSVAAAAAAAGPAPAVAVPAPRVAAAGAEVAPIQEAAGPTSSAPTHAARLKAVVRSKAAARSKGTAPTAASRTKAASRLNSAAAAAEAETAAAAALAAANEKADKTASAATHARAVHATIKKMGLEGREINFASVDSAPTNVGGKGGAVKLLGDLLSGTSGIHGAPYVLHCYAHILHNALETAIKNWGTDSSRLRVGSSGVLQHMLDRVAAKSRLKATELGIKECRVCPMACVTRWNGYTAIAQWLVEHYHLLTAGLQKLLATPKPDEQLLKIAEDLVNPDLMLQVTTLASWGLQLMDTTFSWAEMGSTNLPLMSAHLAQTEAFFAKVSVFSPTPPTPAAASPPAATAAPSSASPSPTAPATSASASLPQAAAAGSVPPVPPLEPFHEVYNIAAQFGLTRVQAWGVIEPFVTSFKKYFHTRTSFYQQPPYCFAAMANPDITLAQAAAVSILEEFDGLDPTEREEAGWGAFRILPVFEEEVRLLAEGTRTSSLHKRLTAIYAAVPVTNASCETALKMLSLVGVSKMLPATVEMNCRVHHDRPFDFVHPTQAQFDAQRRRNRWLSRTASGKPSSAAVTASAAAAATLLDTSALSVSRQAPSAPAHRRKRKHDENTHPRPPRKISAISNIIGVSRAALDLVSAGARGRTNADKAAGAEAAAAMSKVRAIMKARQGPHSNPTELDGSISNPMLQAFLVSIRLPKTGDKQTMMERIVAWSSQSPAASSALPETVTTTSDPRPHAGQAPLPQHVNTGNTASVSNRNILAGSAATPAAPIATFQHVNP